jgi:hypothetical protein
MLLAARFEYEITLQHLKPFLLEKMQMQRRTKPGSYHALEHRPGASSILA